MRYRLKVLLVLFLTSLFLLVPALHVFSYSVVHQSTSIEAQNPSGEKDHNSELKEHAAEETHGAHKKPPVWAVFPFILLLLMIATGPLFYAQFWHKYYPHIAVVLAMVVVLFYLLFLHNYHQPVHSLSEYVSFIALVGSLYIASGGILISVDREGTTMANIVLLLIGSVLANFISTTGASMLLIRPYIRLNQHRIRPFHIVFFIFMVSNIGGALTPIGDPPLFLGYLKGVPFFWTVKHVWVHWLFGIAILSVIFYFFDKRNLKKAGPSPNQSKGKIRITGKKNFVWLLLIILSVFLDPNVFSWVPAINYEGSQISFLRESIMLIVAIFSYKFADQGSLKGNEFNFEPIREVGFLFVGIFGTMMPALELVGDFAHGSGRELVNSNTLYWFTGILSSVLDNAPTYLNFLAAAMAKFGFSINIPQEVVAFSAQNAMELIAVSVSAVFFGAFTYIGNAPNFMVKSIAEQVGISMPSFFGYVVRFSIPLLLPVLLLTFLVFFVL